MPSETIDKVSMAVDKNIRIAGLKMSGPSGTFVEVDFGEESDLSGMWEHQPIPYGQVIFGVKASTAISRFEGTVGPEEIHDEFIRERYFITRLGWQLWDPSKET